MALSRDGRWLAFDSDRGGRQRSTGCRSPAANRSRSSAGSGDDFMPSWSPDGREIAYYGFREGRRRLFVMPVDGGPPSAVAPDSANQRFPTGRRMAAASCSTPTGPEDSSSTWSSGLGMAAGARPGQLTTAGGQEARWSPDGRAIVYVRNTGLWLIAARRRRAAPPDRHRRPGRPADTTARPVGARRSHDLLQGAGWGRADQLLVDPGRRRESQASGALR